MTDSECEVDGNAVKSMTATSVEEIQDSGFLYGMSETNSG